MPQEYYDAIRENNRSTYLLFGIFIALISIFGVIVGISIGSVTVGLIITFMLGALWGGITWMLGDRIILGVSGAKKVDKSEYPYLYNTIEGLAIAAGVPTPEMYIIDDPSPNAFATGKNPKEGKIAVTTGLLKMMNRDELEGVIAHEMSHIKNFDIRTMMIAAVLVGIITMLGNVFFRAAIHSDNDRRGGGAIIIIALAFMIVAPLIAQITKLAISRKREYLADASAVELTRNPDGLRKALLKLANDHTPLKRADGATAHLYIEDPMDKENEGIFKFINSLFSTHPPINDRIKKLEEFGAIG